jgi:sec-independent protein translocase protein TatB
MFDIAFDKLAMIGAVALIVIGPERLPRVARTAGHLLGKAKSYMAQVQQEVKQSMDMEELQKMKGDLSAAANDLHREMHDNFQSIHSDLQTTVHGPFNGDADPHAPYVEYHPTARKNWRIKRAALPHWYKQQTGLRRHVQSGAARVARFRPPAP